MNSKPELDNSTLTSSASAMFQGYNNVTSQALNTAVKGNEVTHSGESQLQYEVTKSLQETFSALNISASLSAGYSGFSGDAKVDFVNQLNLTKESICIIVKASDKQFVTRTNDVTLQSNIKVPETNEQLTEFIKKYGDSYISELVTGAEYYAIYAFMCETSDQRKSLDTQLSVSGISLGGTLSADFQSKLENVCKSSSTTVTFKQMVSGLREPHLPSQDKIIEYALGFFDRDINNPVIISYDSTSYEHVPGFPVNVLDQIRRNVTYFTDPTGDFTKKENDVNEIIDQCKYLKSMYEYYNFTGDNKVNSVLATAYNDLKKLKSQQEEYTYNPLNKFTLPELPSLNDGKPELQFSFNESYAFGGTTGGFEFYDVDHTSYLQKRTRLRNVKLHSGKFIDKLIATYECYDPVYRIYTYEHGGKGGDSGYDLQLPKGVVIYSASCRSGYYIDKLELQSTSGQKIIGGTDGGKPFTYNIPDGYFVVGFRGRADRYLDTLGLVYARILPAIWKK